jgi:anti-sigma B factor antagonist
MSSNPHGREAFPAECVQFRAEIIQFEFDSRIVVALSGELDLATAPMLRACLDSPVLHGTADVEIDMAELTYLDSAGMSVLVQHWRDLNASGGSLVVFNASPMALRLFGITGLTPLLLNRAEDRLLPMPR